MKTVLWVQIQHRCLELASLKGSITDHFGGTQNGRASSSAERWMELMCGGHGYYLYHIVSLAADVCDADGAVKSQLRLLQQRRGLRRTGEWRPFAYKENKTEATA